MKDRKNERKQKLNDALSGIRSEYVRDAELTPATVFSGDRPRSAVTKWVIVAAATVALVAVMFTCFILNGVVRERWGQPGTTSQNPSFSITETPGTTASPITTVAPVTTESPNTTEAPESTKEPETTGTPEATTEPAVTECDHKHTRISRSEPSCNEPGYIYVYCNFCEEEVSRQQLPPLEHDCDASGLCKSCGYVVTSDGLMFHRMDDGTGLMFCGVGYSFQGERLDIPAEYCGEPVVEVFFPDVYRNLEDKFPQIPDSVTVLHVPSSVKTITSALIPNTASLKEIILDEGVEFIDDGAFYQSQISSLVIPSTVKTVERFAFASCENLTDIQIRCSFDAIDDYAFLGVSAFEQLPEFEGPKGLRWSSFHGEPMPFICLEGPGTFHDSVLRLETPITYISEGAFRDCTFLEEVYLSELTSGARGYPTNGELFAGCTNLKKVEFGGIGLIFSLGDRTFAGCSSLETVIIPRYPYDGNILIIPKNCFEGCSSLKEIVFGGTCEVWMKIMAQTTGSDSLPIGTVIHCTDGDLAAEKNWDSFTRISG